MLKWAKGRFEVKIFGLIDVEELTISSEFDVNLENFRIFSYKLSELGAEEIVVAGEKMLVDKVVSILKDELDVLIVSLEDLEIMPATVEEFMKGSKKDVLILKDKEILRIFNIEKTLLPNAISVLTYKAKREGIKTLITSDVESAKIALIVP